MKSISSASLALVLVSRALPASADLPPPPPKPFQGATSAVRYVRLPDPERVPVRIESETPGLRYTLRRLEDDAPVVACARDCTVVVPRGKYRLSVPTTAKTRGGRPKTAVEEPSTVTVRAPSHDQRWVGLGIAAGGHALMLGGIHLVLDNMCLLGTCSGDASLRTLGTMMVLGGGAVAPIGWVHFGKGLSARAKVRPMEGSASARATRVGITSNEDGTTVHAAMNF